MTTYVQLVFSYSLPRDNVDIPAGTTMATRVLSKLLPYTQICSTRVFFLYEASIFSAATYSPAAKHYFHI